MGVEPDKAICAPMIGNSMAEKIEDGSTIAIDRSLTQVVDGEIYALCAGARRHAAGEVRLPPASRRVAAA